jgi:tetratricopeptide (TPR) repeat protein
MRGRSVSLAMVAAAGLATSSCVTFETRSEGRARRVIDQAVEAIGGIRNFRATRSMVITADYGKMTRMRPNLRIVGCVPGVCGQWKGYVEGFDGQRGWEFNPARQRLIRTRLAAERALRCGAEFDELFIDYRRRGYRPMDSGREELNGRTVDVVRFTPGGCPARAYYFDSETHMLAASLLEAPIHARGTAVATMAYFSDYRPVAGVLRAFHVAERIAATGEATGNSQIVSIEVNTLSDPGIFRAPEAHPGPGTRLVLEMLDASERESAARVLGRYAQFRTDPANKDVDTENDLDWLGYELLKADRYDMAIPVIRIEIREHPRSGNAYDSLGDGYAQLGDPEAAMAAYERAVELDPKLADTLHKLEKLRASAR